MSRILLSWIINSVCQSVADESFSCRLKPIAGVVVVVAVVAAAFVNRIPHIFYNNLQNNSAVANNDFLFFVNNLPTICYWFSFRRYKLIRFIAHSVEPFESEEL